MGIELIKQLCYNYGKRGGANMGLTILSYSGAEINQVELLLRTILGDLTEYTCLTYPQLQTIDRQIDDDLVLLTAPDRFDLFVPYLAPGTPYIKAKRTINPKKIKDLLGISPESEVLVVNYQKENSMTMIAEMQALGINLRYTPFDPDHKPDRSFVYAITPGYVSLVPPGIPNVINVGLRVLSIVTIAEIVHHFTGSLDYDDLVFTRYVRDFVELSNEITMQYNENLSLRLQLENVVAHFESGIIIEGHDGKVVNHNQMAANILGIKGMNGKAVTEVLTGFETGQKERFLKRQGNTIHITAEMLDSEPEHATKMYILKDMDMIRSVDEQYRRYERHQGHRAKYQFQDILHRNPGMDTLIEKARRFARSNSNVLIQGESGTGKELFAQAIHNASARCKRPFVAINCAAISESLLESELFGYESGAFTGALKGGKRGLFEQAHTGTIFLDEIGDASLSIQTKLLRVLQEKEVLRVAGEKVIPVDVRFIAATNQDLKKNVDEGLFRHDLYYRLNVLPLRVPPLRERREDIELLLHYYIQRHSLGKNLPQQALTQAAWDVLLGHTWPGNVREIVNIAEYIVNTSAMTETLANDLQAMFGSPATPPVKHSEKAIFFSEERHAECLELLRLLSADTPSGYPGRKQLTVLMRAHGYQLSEQQIKTRLEQLRKMGYLQTMQGRGSRVTEAGLALVSRN